MVEARNRQAVWEGGEGVGERGRIRALRKKAGLSQEALAQKVGVSRVTVSAWENIRAGDIKSGHLKRLADALGCSMDFLLGYEKKQDCP